MKIKKVILKGFKRFHDLTIDLGENPKKVIALVGPNGSGKSSIFDAFERKGADYKGSKIGEVPGFYSKRLYSSDLTDDHTIQIEYTLPNQQLSKISYLIRSAYRFTGRINVTSLTQKSDIVNDDQRPATSIDMDSRLQDNYERLFAQYVTEIQDSELTGKALKEKLIQEINGVLQKVLDIKIVSLGNILENNQGKFFFEKGTSKNFPYDNLSSGEKEVLDIIIDLIVKRKVYTDTVFCIDEPELHLNTAIQRKLLVEIAKLIPENCQLWIATHSVGFLRALQEELSLDCQILDFSEGDFDQAINIQPMRISRSSWQRIFKTALEDLTGLIAPKKIIYCEGRIDPNAANEELGFDALIYNEIFGPHLPDIAFVSSGGSTEPHIYAEFAIVVFGKILRDIKILHLADRDINSDGSLMTPEQRTEWIEKKPVIRRMLKRREIENYIFDFEILASAFPEVTQDKYAQIVTNIVNDDVKAKFAQIRELCGDNNLSRKEFSLILAKKIDPGTAVYQELTDCLDLDRPS
ncbi:MAG: ATP-binding protein [Alphaproteobacteria bacterium]|nr:ATP-binding protein [Alphaproteobacteria bacterium]